MFPAASDLLLLLRDGDGPLPEAVPKPPPDGLEVLHPAGPGGLPPDGLHGPVVLADPLARVAAGGADLLLDVEGHLAATAAQRVRLVVTLSERASSLRLKDNFMVFS